MEFVVYIERKETYCHKVLVDAESKEEAERKVRDVDRGDGFYNEWNEIQPAVSTDYSAEPVENADLVDGEKECLFRVD